MNVDCKTITCHFCFELFEVDLEVSEAFNGHISEIYDCTICCNPNKIDYDVCNNDITGIVSSDGNQ